MFGKIQDYFYKIKWDAKIAALLKSRGLPLSEFDYVSEPQAPKSGIEWTAENRKLLENNKWWAVYFGRNLTAVEKMNLPYGENPGGSFILFFPRNGYAEACKWWNEMNKRTTVNKKIDKIIGKRK